MPRNAAVLMMQVVLVFFVIVTLAFTATCYASSSSPVNPFQHIKPEIGTEGLGFGHGGIPISSQPPMAFSRPGPQTTAALWLEHQHFGGYLWSDNMIRCFQSISMVGAGVGDLGALGVMPLATKSAVLEERHVITDGAKAFFSHQEEVRQPGEYQVSVQGALPDSGPVTTRIASRYFSAAYSFEFTNTTAYPHSFLLLDASRTLTGHACKQSEIQLHVISSQNGEAMFHEMTGKILIAGSLSGRSVFKKRFGGGITVYFSLRSDKPLPVSNFGVWDEKGPHYNRTTSTGCPSGGFLEFLESARSVNRGNDGSSSSLELKFYMGLSLLSVAEAQSNLRLEMSNGKVAANSEESWKSLQEISQQSQQEWKDKMDRIALFQSETPTALEKSRYTKFYSALYHALLAPTRYSEPNGKYLGFDAKQHSLSPGQSAFYSDLSIWDVHRTTMPLLALVYPNVHRDISQSLLLMHEQSGCLPKWSIGPGDAECMIGQHASVILTDSILKGTLPKEKWEEAYEAMRSMATKPCATGGRPSLDDYWNQGYIPFESESKAACLTLEFAYDDGCISRVAKLLNHTADAALFHNASQFYRNVFDPKTKFFCPKTKSGDFDCPSTYLNVFDPRYVEGDAWHYRFFVMHDPEGLIQLYSSKEEFAQQLNKFMEIAEWDQFTGLPNPYYWSGNEHNLASPFMYAFIDGWKYAAQMQRQVRWLLDNMYTTEANGLSGNDDYGTLSSWFVWASMGLYPMAGDTRYVLIAPLFERIQIQTGTQTGGGNQECHLEIISRNYSPHRMHVSKVVLNGKELASPIVNHQDLVEKCEGRLEFFMRD